MSSYDRDLSAFLSGFVTDKRLARMESVLSERTRYLAVAVEDIYQPHNASAVLRTCDALGVQDVHVIENRNTYRINPGVELGTAQWLSLQKYRGEQNMTLKAYELLRKSGYRIVATTPHTDDVDLENFDIHAGKCVFVFGNELDGISDIAKSHADEFLRIPMYGFVESYNISVSAAIVLHTMVQRLKHSTIDWRLADDEKSVLLLKWLRGTVTKASALEDKFKIEQKE